LAGVNSVARTSGFNDCRVNDTAQPARSPDRLSTDSDRRQSGAVVVRSAAVEAEAWKWDQKLQFTSSPSGWLRRGTPAAVERGSRDDVGVRVAL